MFGIGIPELVLILIIGLVVFGPGRLPEVGRAVGKGLREFKKASGALTEAINAPEPIQKLASSATIQQQPQPQQTNTQNTQNENTANAATNTTTQGYVAPTQESVRAQIEKQKQTTNK